jgi:anti-anti-sigma factor
MAVKGDKSMTLRANDEVVVLEPRGDLCEGAECDEMERLLLDLAGQGRQVLIDLSKTQLLTARSLGILVRARQRAAANSGFIAIYGASRLQRWLLERTGLDAALRVFADEAAARGAL